MSKLLIDESPLQVLPSLAVAIGLNEAIFLQQLHYWLTPTAKYQPHYREFEGKMSPWIYNTYHTKNDEKETGWQANFPFWSVRTIKRIVSSLKEKGLIIVTDQFNTASSNRTLWYTIDHDKLATYEKVSTSSDNLALSGSDNLALSRGGQLGTLMTETTTENTTENGATPQKSQQLGQQQIDPDFGSELDLWFQNPNAQTNEEDTAIRRIEEIWQKKRLAHDTKQAMVYYYLAMLAAFPETQIPRDKTTQGKWAAAVKDHLDNYSLAELKTLYPLAVQHAIDNKWEIYSPHSLTSALSKVKSQAPLARPQPDYQDDPQYQAFAEAFDDE